ncbi:glycosyltransferase family 87 protein [Tabrizicola sp.]|uniref:glycosyltransferase family 87 protein n=1 Tax=Tabrizicola sp. TaxID=2005166 RepID=UPI0026292C8A|nr:glycosyltransferase family 87 protein [Tabrizicola sp.]MDM7930824.1 glycosyltransferase family 87 protein [Tabrizicola sp.]
MQDRQAILAADARLAPFAGRAGMLFAVLAAVAGLSFVGIMLATSFILTAKPDVLAMSIDFRVFWAAARLAMEGDPLAVHDTARLAAAHATNPDSWMPWLYPPGYLLLITPFGTLTFSVAYLVWTGLSLLAMVLAVRPFVAGVAPIWIAMTLAPAYYPAFMLGQNSLFWMAGLLAALAALRAERWVLAGLFIGLLTLKPQLGVLLPVALLAMGAWRTILVAIATTVVLALLPTLVYGVDYWPLLVATVTEQGSRMVYSLVDLFLVISPVYLLALLGMAPALALKLQWVILGLAALAVFALWRSERIGFDAKAAGLLAAMLLSAPYLWYYEAALMAAIALFLLRAGILGTAPGHLLLLGMIWMGGSLQALNNFAELVDQRLLGAVIITPLLVVSLGLCLSQLVAARRNLARPA